MQRISEARAVYVSPMSVYEIGQKCRLGKWDAMRPYLDELPQYLRQQGAPLTAERFLLAAKLDWDHKDPFDRILVATLKIMRIQIVTTDRAIRGYFAETE